MTTTTIITITTRTTITSIMTITYNNNNNDNNNTNKNNDSNNTNNNHNNHNGEVPAKTTAVMESPRQMVTWSMSCFCFFVTVIVVICYLLFVISSNMSRATPARDPQGSRPARKSSRGPLNPLTLIGFGRVMCQSLLLMVIVVVIDCHCCYC